MNILVTGGARSGKSRYAQELAIRLGGPVLFVATAEAGDEEMRQRIEQHRRARPPSWRTLEVTTGVGNEIIQGLGSARVVIIDCITLLISNILTKYSDATGENIDASAVEDGVNAEIDQLLECFKRTDTSFIIVTNEVGLGLVPVSKMSRLYRDLLGRANQLLAEEVDEVCLMVAGLPVTVKPAAK
ncbi:MAG: bifunctional adenosylcobinamide kinase/adenosylcobinamide-phosphate guanylyltransferase [Dehalococcoidales bacterium]|nr:MAG: bifunctional adenosylcobinamide kinase/adenosylcobinamide-phosphate guanylyltransferase [Dehalococcoidales bacterium]